MMQQIPSNYTSMEILRQAQHENPNPSPVLKALFDRCENELSYRAPESGSTPRVTRAK